MWRNFRFLHICHVEKFEITQHVEKCQISPHLSCGKIGNYSECGEISDFSTSVMHINLKFLHMTNFSPHISLVILVTNIRYAICWTFKYFMFSTCCMLDNMQKVKKWLRDKILFTISGQGWFLEGFNINSGRPCIQSGGGRWTDESALSLHQ